MKLAIDLSLALDVQAHNNDEALGWYVPSHGDILIEVAGY